MTHHKERYYYLATSSVIFLLCLFSVDSLSGQLNNLGLPYTQQYTKHDYQGGTQNWDFAQDKKGNIFIANNEGLLTFNGTHWAIYPLPNHTIVRSLSYDSIHNRLYAGGQDAFGYFTPVQDNGDLKYIDCKNKIAAHHRQFTDVWNTVLGSDGQVFFRSAGNIYHIQEDTAIVHSFDNVAAFLGKINRQVVVQEFNSGLKQYQNGKFIDLPGFDILKDKTIVAICQGIAADESWIVTLKNGIYHSKGSSVVPYPIQQQPWLEALRIETANISPNGLLALGSSSEGLVIVDLLKKRIHWRLNKSNGLQQNYIRSVFFDQNHDLWLGLDNGINFVALNSPYSRFIPDVELESTTYTVRIFDDLLYVGSGNGLYAAPWKGYYDPIDGNNIFQLVEGSQGQVWSLDEVKGKLWMGHEEGAFQVDGYKLIRHSTDFGYWKFLAMEDNSGQSQLIAGNYLGLRMLDQANEPPVFSPVSDLKESARIIAKNEKQLWISHPYRGVYQVDFSKPTQELSARFHGKHSGLPSDLENYVFSVFGELLICAENGIYRYDTEKDSFLLHANYSPYFPPDEQFRRLVPDKEGNLWYISSTEAGILRINQRGLEKQVSQERYPEIRSLLVGGFEYIYPFDKKYVFFGAEKGVIILNPDKPSISMTKHSTQLTKVLLSLEKGDELQWTGQFKPALQPKFEFESNEKNFKFEFTTPVFGELTQIEYQYYLEGLEENYGVWIKNTAKEYTNLPAGDYTFYCRSRINKGEAGAADYFSFTILPPWYLTNTAFTVYSFFILAGLWLLIHIPRNKFAKEKAEMVQQQEMQAITFEQEVQASEKTIDQLKAEKYRSDLAYQSKELASLTMHIVQKNELISRIGSEIKNIKEKLKNSEQEKLVRPLEQLLTEDEIIENDWEQFVYHFDQVHSGFFQRLRQKYPQLTPKDHKLCAYLRMNLSTKDIAPLLNISVRGVEISRYRLRRKMELSKEENLVAFMMNF